MLMLACPMLFPLLTRAASVPSLPPLRSGYMGECSEDKMITDFNNRRLAPYYKPVGSVLHYHAEASHDFSPFAWRLQDRS